MEDKAPGPVKGYQKQVKKEEKPVKPAKPKGSYAPSPTAQKWPALVEAIENGNVEAVTRMIEEGINVNLSRNGITPLMLAASKGHTAVAEVVLQAGVNINAKDDDGNTALHKAVVDQADTSIVELLMHSGIDVAAQNNAKKTALQLAEQAKHRDIIQLMKKDQLKAEADALEWAAFLNSPEGKPFKQQKLYERLESIIKFIWLPPAALVGVGLLLGMLVHAVLATAAVCLVLGLLASAAGYLLHWKIGRYLDGLGPLPYLDIAIVREKHKAGEKITVGKRSRNNFAEGLAVHAQADGEPEVHFTADAAESGPGLDEEDGPASAAKYAPRSGASVVVVSAIAGALVLVILSGALFLYWGSIAKWYFTKKIEHKGLAFSSQAFFSEVAKNDEENVDLFIKAGMPLDTKNEKGQTALMVAAEKGHVGMVGRLAVLNTELLTHVDAGGNTALMNAARLGQMQSMQVLIEKGAGVNFVVPTAEGAATVLQAVLDVPDFTAAHMSIVTYLLQHNASVATKNAAGRSPLLFAAARGRADAVALLIEKGADVNDRDGKGNFPLLASACKGDKGLLSLLADKGADMKMALPDGQTPLMCAAREGRDDAVAVLLERGAAVNAKATDGSTALTAASRAGNAAMVKMLLEKGADPVSGYLPDPFINLNGKTIAVTARKSRLSDVLGNIAKTALLDGYTVSLSSRPEQKINLQIKGAWNRVLTEIATRNNLALVIKDTTIFVLPYNPAAIKREAPVAAPAATP